jgi:predicted membrane channel-forming protein YqfA (hemolysin III family)
MNPSLILSIISGEASAAARRARRSAVEYIIAAAAALIGFVFLLLAAFVYASRFYGELTVAVAFAAGFLALAVVLLIYHRISARARARRARERMSNEAIALAVPIGLALLPALLTKRGAMAGLVASALAAVGYAIYRENAGSGDGDDDSR